MSNIPSQAISSALVPVQRAANDQIRARQVQFKKNDHHSEEVQELDDTAVNSVRDQKQHEGRKEEEEKKREEGEHVEIEALKEVPVAVPVKGEDLSHLDISA